MKSSIQRALPNTTTSSKSLWSRYGKWTLLAVRAIALFAAGYFLPVKNWVEAFNGWVEQRGALGYVIFVAAYAVATVFFVPGSLITLGAALAFGFWPGLPLVSIGSTLGAAMAFLIARYFVRSRVQDAAKNNEKFAAMDEAIGKEGWKMVALLRLSPLLPFNLSNYLYGATKIAFWPYLAASWVGMKGAAIEQSAGHGSGCSLVSALVATVVDPMSGGNACNCGRRLGGYFFEQPPLRL